MREGPGDGRDRDRARQDGAVFFRDVALVGTPLAPLVNLLILLLARAPGTPK